ncbi:MAG: type III-A CRISPR-associated RAMP protein Csm3 [Anaerolineales bacterium]|nr:type III-A CRISPR-associated RAMP protein Csm3 [Anaerolineales bacterium]
MADEKFKTIKLLGRVFFTFDLETVTGLHIGGSDTGIEIGGVDKTVIRDTLTNRPYIPGSSLKGKMRSLMEKYLGLKQNQPIHNGFIHSCGAEYKTKEDLEKKGKPEYKNCDVCQVFGIPGERDFSTPTRLIVRDVQLTDASAKELEDSKRTDFPFTEVKTEVSIDRVTAAANPRQMERVPAGVVFAPGEIIFSVYHGDDCDAGRDIDRLKAVVSGLQLLEDDFLGGLGSRGSGKVRLANLKVGVRSKEKYLEDPAPLGKGQYATLAELGHDLATIQADARRALGV